jgi:hypothetical protein
MVVGSRGFTVAAAAWLPLLPLFLRIVASRFTLAELGGGKIFLCNYDLFIFTGIKTLCHTKCHIVHMLFALPANNCQVLDILHSNLNTIL